MPAADLLVPFQYAIARFEYDTAESLIWHYRFLEHGVGQGGTRTAYATLEYSSLDFVHSGKRIRHNRNQHHWLLVAALQSWEVKVFSICHVPFHLNR